MAGEVRELLAAAQEAELKGDVRSAVALLARAATLYEEQGSTSRALKMLRHALRLDAGRADLAARLGELEARDEPPPDVSSGTHDETTLPSLGDTDALETAAREALASLEQREAAGAGEAPVTSRRPGRPPPREVQAEVQVEVQVEVQAPPTVARRRGPAAGERVLVERGPVLAGASLEAWCSFCCRPASEVGRLVAAPTGSFVCGGCARQALALLGAELPVGAPPAGAPARAPTPRAAAAPAPRAARPPPGARRPLFGRAGTLAAVAEGRRRGARRLLLVGPEGAGRSSLLAALAAEAGVTPLAAPRLPGAAATPDAEGELPPGPLYVDDAETLPPALVHRLAELLEFEPERELVLVACRAPEAPAAAPLALEAEEGRVPLWTGAALAAVAPGVPAALAAHLQQVVPVDVPEAPHVERLAEHLLARLRPDVRAAPELVAALAAEARRAPHLLHELVALVRRLPSGTVRLAPTVPPKESPP